MSLAFGFALPHWQAISGGFSPASLFAGGTVAGAWYDPSDLSTMFDTSAGTTPVAMPGQGAAVPVGLMLDKSQGLAGLGTENIVNGNFNDGTTGWSAFAGATISVVSNELNILCPALSGNGAIQNFVTVPGVSYSGSFRLVNLGTFTAIRLRINNVSPASTIAELQYGSTGVFTFKFTAQTTLTQLQYFPVAGTAPGTFIIDDVSVKTLGAGNHAIAFNNTTARPELRARVNLLTYSEDFSQGVWGKTAVTVTANTAVAPDGATTADTLTETTAFNYHSTYFTNTVAAGQSITGSFALKKNSARYAQINYGGTAAGRWVQCVIDLDTGLITQSSAGAGGTLVSSSSTSLGDGWYRVSLTGSVVTDTTTYFYVGTVSSATPSFNTYGFEERVGSTSNSIYIWGADLRPANIGANVPAYQRIADANTYDTSGFPLYLHFDGIDDSMYTPANLNLSGTDKVAVFAGVRRLAEAFYPMVVESGATGWDVNNGAFGISGGDPSGEWRFGVRGAGGAGGTVYYDPVTYTPPITNVLSMQADLSGSTKATTIIPRVNGVLEQEGGAGTTSGGGNFGTYPLFIGARNNSSLWFNGHLHSLIIAGSAVSASNISATEQWVAGKTGIVIP